jgi:hypothetical protein
LWKNRTLFCWVTLYLRRYLLSDIR